MDDGIALYLMPPSGASLEQIYRHVKDACVDVSRTERNEEQRTAADKARRKKHFLQGGDGHPSGYLGMELSRGMSSMVNAGSWQQNPSNPVVLKLVHKNAFGYGGGDDKQSATREVARQMIDSLQPYGYKVDTTTDSRTDGNHHLLEMKVTVPETKKPDELFEDLWTAMRQVRPYAAAEYQRQFKTLPVRSGLSSPSGEGNSLTP
jgi:hypothetical protein